MSSMVEIGEEDKLFMETVGVWWRRYANGIVIHKVGELLENNHTM